MLRRLLWSGFLLGRLELLHMSASAGYARRRDAQKSRQIKRKPVERYVTDLMV